MVFLSDYLIEEGFNLAERALIYSGPFLGPGIPIAATYLLIGGETEIFESFWLKAGLSILVNSPVLLHEFIGGFLGGVVSANLLRYRRLRNRET